MSQLVQNRLLSILLVIRGMGNIIEVELFIKSIFPFSSVGETSGSVSPSPQPHGCEEAEPAPKRRKCTRDDVDAAMLLHLQGQAERRKQQQELTEDDLFGRHVACVLKRLNNRAKATARLQMEQVLMDCEFPEPRAHASSYEPSTSFTNIF